MSEDTVILEIGSKEYVCSKSTLSQSSEYFQIMFTGDFAEKKMSRIKLSNVTVKSWEYIQFFMENGLIIADANEKTFMDEMLELLQTVNMFRFVDIEERCGDIISNSVDASNCFQVLDVATRIESKALMRKAKSFALSHFDDVAPTDAFNKLKSEQIEEYCGNAALYCAAGEWGIWKAIDKWLGFNDGTFLSRKGLLSRLVMCLHLPSLTSENLKQMLLYDSVKSCPLVFKAIKRVLKDRELNASAVEPSDAKKPKKSDQDPEEITSFVENWLKTKPRVKAKVPCIVGSIYTGSDTTSPYIIKFCESEKRFIPLTRLRKMESLAGVMMGYKVVSDGFKIYLLGGLIMNRQNLYNDAVWTYDPTADSWSFFVGMTRPLRNMSVCILENDLYVMGGFGRHRVIQNQMSKLCLNNRIWSDCASVPQNFYSTPCVVFRNSIYLVDCNIYEYVPKEDVWRTVSTKPFAIGFSCAVADDKYIYVAGSCTNAIYKLNPSDIKEELEILGRFKHECAQICLVDGYIYSLSQEEHADDIFCEKMNVETGETVVLYEGKTDSVIADITPRHRHGCFAFFAG